MTGSRSGFTARGFGPPAKPCGAKPPGQAAGGLRSIRAAPPHVEGGHCLTATAPGRQHAVGTVIEDAQHDMLRRAHPPTVITEEDAAVLADGCPQLVAGRDLNDAVIDELAGGQRDVFTAACGDQLSGLHGPKGKPCPARPRVCLLCPPAVFAPRHAGSLLRLKAFFSRQWQQMPAARFMAVFGPCTTRIQQVLGRFGPAFPAAASSHAEDLDDELPLRPEEMTVWPPFSSRLLPSTAVPGSLPVPMAAVKPDSFSPGKSAVRCSRTASGTSSMSSACPSGLPFASVA
jgi:hypothetical protein